MSASLPVNTPVSNVNVKDVLKFDLDILSSAKMVDGNYTEKIVELNEKVQNMSNLMNSDGGKIVLQQNHLTDLVKNESIRLENQKKSIDIAKTSQERLISLNENYMKRNMEFWKIFIACTVEITFLLILSFLNLPTFIFLILAIISAGGVAMYSINMLIHIYSRDGIQFDELALEPPLSVSKNEIASPVVKDASGNLIGTADSKTCHGNSCCSSTTMWNPKIQKCEKLIDGFSTLNSAYHDNMIVAKQPSKEMKQLEEIIPFESRVSEKYTKI